VVSAEDVPAPLYISTDETSDDDYYDYVFSNSAKTEEHFNQMADEIGLNVRQLNVYHKDDQQEIITAWVEHTYGEYCQTGGKRVLTSPAETRSGSRTSIPVQAPLSFGRNRIGIALKASMTRLEQDDCAVRARQPARKGACHEIEWKYHSRQSGIRTMRTVAMID